ncbi:hypothetical protein [Deinococcus hopiensis]|uniref:Lipoprotein n=1 Tax=Deinococcus hopiensis KR-140 TaxID=695939 RepID=A0A1W1VL49_9DEIO|nr:hypothetical protein [Deinococcus hopiensis]SMB94003.1 hypothetical protein SAMN00790413_02207 [Deinococcus hopiensis KR-140]
MKKLGLFALPLLVAGCGLSGTDAPTRPYTITIEPLGYRVTGTTARIITITSATINLYSAAGAPDVSSIDYTAIILNSKGDRAALDNSVIVPATGTLLGRARGGYVCTNTSLPSASCSMSRPDAIMTNTGPLQWIENSITKFVMPFEWAVAHDSAFSGVNVPGEDPAGWYAQFTFTANQTNGRTVTWKQNYQIVSPAGS